MGRHTPKSNVAADARRWHWAHCCEGSVRCALVLSGIPMEGVDVGDVLWLMRDDCPRCRKGDYPVHGGRECRGGR